MRFVLVLLVIGLEGMSLVVLYYIVSCWNSVFAMQLWHLLLNSLFLYIKIIMQKNRIVNH